MAELETVSSFHTSHFKVYDNKLYYIDGSRSFIVYEQEAEHKATVLFDLRIYIPNEAAHILEFWITDCHILIYSANQCHLVVCKTTRQLLGRFDASTFLYEAVQFMSSHQAIIDSSELSSYRMDKTKEIFRTPIYSSLKIYNSPYVHGYFVPSRMQYAFYPAGCIKDDEAIEFTNQKTVVVVNATRFLVILRVGDVLHASLYDNHRSPIHGFFCQLVCSDSTIHYRNALVCNNILYCIMFNAGSKHTLYKTSIDLTAWL
jgi:hypothetical protein